MAVKQTSSGSSIHIGGHIEGRNIRVGHGLPPRQPLADHRISDRLGMSYESRPESGTRRIYLAEGTNLLELEVAKGLESRMDFAGHRVEIGDGQLFIDGRRFDFERRDFEVRRPSPGPKGPSAEQQLDNLKKRFPEAKFIGEAANLSSIVIGDGVKIEGTVHLTPGLQLAGDTFVSKNGVVKGGIISGSGILGTVEGGTVTNSLVDGGARVSGGELDRAQLSRGAHVSGGRLTNVTLTKNAKVSGGALRDMRLEPGAEVSGGDLRGFTLKAGQKVSGGKHHGSQRVDTERLRAAAGALKKIDREDAQAALEALKLGLDEAERFEGGTRHDRRVKREVVSTLKDQIAEASALLSKLEGAKSQSEVDALMNKVDAVAERGSEAITRLRKQSAAPERPQTPLGEIGIEPDVFRRYVQTALLQLGPLPGTQAVAGPQNRAPTYTEALMQMQYADILRAQQQQPVYPPNVMQSYGQAQMPPWLFGAPQPSPQVMTTVPPQYPQQPSGWGKAAMFGAGGLLLGMGLGSFGMGTFGLGMGMLPMMMGMGGMGMMGMGGMGMMGMGMFGF